MTSCLARGFAAEPPCRTTFPEHLFLPRNPAEINRLVMIPIGLFLKRSCWHVPGERSTDDHPNGVPNHKIRVSNTDTTTLPLRPPAQTDHPVAFGITIQSPSVPLLPAQRSAWS